VPKGTSASYRYLCAGIVETYRLLGVDAVLTSRDRGERHPSACYLHATEADVSVGAAKLSGSAQVWRGGTCLQHGSFTRTRAMQREQEVFGLDRSQATAMVGTTATLEDLRDEVPDVDSIVRAVAEGFKRGLGVELTRGELSDCERERANALVAEFEVEGS
jgi:lipoate-protein ligase A